MPRYVGTLHKLCENGPHKKGGWNDLLTYLELHSVGDPNALNPTFDSPLPPYTAPSPSLKRELVDRQGSRKEDTPLRIICRTAPANVLAAILHLGPEAAQIADSRGRLPLHVACRRPTGEKEDERAVKNLIQAYPQGLLHRDDSGRTPLHYLLFYHANTRSTRLLECFLVVHQASRFEGLRQPHHDFPPIPQPTSTAIPPTAAIIPDARYGCLPLHYAVMEGASKDVIRLLLQAYPASKTVPDKFGRLALHWYLGAGMDQHVSGEVPDPNAKPLWEKKRSATVVGLLLNSKSARTADREGRVPLHWASGLAGLYAHYYEDDSVEHGVLSLKVIQSLLDHYSEATMVQDRHGLTPLHILFHVVIKQQEVQWERLQRNKLVRDNINLRNGGGGFKPPIAVIELLLRQAAVENPVGNTDERLPCAANVEDPQGHLPLHLAVMTAPSPQAVQVLIQAHPTALLHTADNLQTPLHCALAKPYSAPLQTEPTMKLLLLAYVTSRHGTFVNGKLALKMEDGAGNYPLHYACFNHACYDVNNLFVETYPKAAALQNGLGDLPLHCLLDTDNFFEPSQLGLNSGATLSAPMGWMSESESEFGQIQHRVQEETMDLLVKPLLTLTEGLEVSSSAHGLLPLHIVVAFDAVDYSTLYRMLLAYPDATKVFTTQRGHKYSALDLHEMRRSSTPDVAHWMDVRELLFSFGPTLQVHRHEEELLEQCARLVREEVEGKGSHHMEEYMAYQHGQLRYQELELKATLSSIAPPDIDRGYKPKRTTPRAHNRLGLPKPAVSMNSKTNGNKGKKAKAVVQKEVKSIYDDDDGKYVVSQDEDDLSDDDYFDDDFEDNEGYSYDDSRHRRDDFDEESYDGDSYTYDSRTFDDTLDDRTIDTRTTCDDNRTADSRRTKGSRRSRKTKDSETVGEASIEHDSVIPENGYEEEKKDEEEEEKKPPLLSDVAMRVWTFFVLYNNPEDPSDNYAESVSLVVDGLPFNSITALVNCPLPPFAQQYLPDEVDVQGKSLADVAHNSCKAIVHKASYFAGKYEFRHTAQERLVMHRSNDDMTIHVRAVEYILNTEEWVHPEEEEAGKAEEQIWNTGCAPPPVHDSMSSVFDVKSRKVCMKFMRSQQAYLREVECRKDMGVSVIGNDTGKNVVVPLINHMRADPKSKRAIDRRYQFDIDDERFSVLDLGGGEILKPADYPYVVVLPFHDDGDLFDHFLHHGRMDKSEIVEIGLQVGNALQTIHQKGLVHGKVSLSSITWANPSVDSDENEPYWALNDLSGACSQSTSLLAGISSTGAANFSTSTFPPELFVKLNPPEVKLYNAYWEAVKTKLHVDVDPIVVSPHVDPSTGDSYVLRCFFDPDDKESSKCLPKLPYKLVAAKEATDVWAFGRIMFTLCSAGHSMFATNIKTHDLLAYDQIANFDKRQAGECIYKHVEDPLAQDLLFHLLSSYEERSKLTMAQILNHPFFVDNDDGNKSREAHIQKIIAHRQSESAAHVRSLNERHSKQAEGEWVTHRSKNLHCWSLDFSIRMHLAPSTLLRSGLVNAPDIPFGMLLLPYKLARNKSGKLTPSTKKDVERAEKMGIQLLALVKACQFAGRMEDAVQSPEHFDTTWSSTALLDAMKLSTEEKVYFEEHTRLLTTLAASQVELFRDDPVVIARRIVQQRIVELQQCVVEDSTKAYLYLVDEFSGTPVLQAPYPFEVTEKIQKVMENTLPIMYLNVVFSCAVAGSIAGLVKLIFEAAYPHLPPSWSAASTGVRFELKKNKMEQQVNMLRASLAEMYGGTKMQRRLDDLQFLQTYLEKCDTKNSYANLKRVTNGEAAMWAVDVAKIEEAVKRFDIFSAFEEQEEQKRKLEAQSRRIQELEKALETAEFKRKLNLKDVE